MSKEITVHEKRDIAELPLQGMNDLAQLGNFIAQSGMLGASSPAAGMVIATTCVQERMSILEFGRRYHVDGRGKVTMRSDRMLAEFMALGGTVEWLQWDKEAALGKWSYGANKDKEIGFTYKEAEEAGYIKPNSNWEKDPAAQLRARCITRAVRMICPAAAAGVYCPEEMQDVYDSKPAMAGVQPVAIDVTAQPVNQTIEETPFDEPDYSVCPVPNNEFTGKKWSDIPTDQLNIALGLTHGAMEDGHRAAINEVLACRN